MRGPRTTLAFVLVVALLAVPSVAQAEDADEPQETVDDATTTVDICSRYPGTCADWAQDVAREYPDELRHWAKAEGSEWPDEVHAWRTTVSGDIEEYALAVGACASPWYDCPDGKDIVHKRFYIEYYPAGSAPMVSDHPLPYPPYPPLPSPPDPPSSPGHPSDVRPGPSTSSRHGDAPVAVPTDRSPPGSTAPDDGDGQGTFWTAGPGRMPPTGELDAGDPLVWIVITSTLAAVLAFPPLFRLYRQLSAENALDHDLRSAILDRVRDAPGVTPTELADALDVTRQTVTYHVHVLEDLKFIVTERDGGSLRLYDSRNGDDQVRDLVAALRRDGRGTILRLLRDEPGLRLSEIARRLDWHRSTAKYHADRLAEAGLVERNGDTGRPLAVPDEILDTWDRIEADTEPVR